MEDYMAAFLRVFIPLLTMLAILGLIAAGCDSDEGDTEERTGCGHDYELEFTATIDYGEGNLDQFTYRLIEYNDGFLKGNAFGEQPGEKYSVLGRTTGNDSYIVKFSPGLSFRNFPCDSPMTLTLDLKDLVGNLHVYCDLVKFETFPAFATVSCDKTGVSLD